MDRQTHTDGRTDGWTDRQSDAAWMLVCIKFLCVEVSLSTTKQRYPLLTFLFKLVEFLISFVACLANDSICYIFVTHIYLLLLWRRPDSLDFPMESLTQHKQTPEFQRYLESYRIAV